MSEVIAIFRIVQDREVRITTWNETTPYRVAIHFEGNYLNGTYCADIKDALRQFNHKIENSLEVYGEKKPKIELDLNKDESLREYLIDQVLENNEPDQILIDLLKVDLLDLAEQELIKTTTQQLKDLV